MYILQDVCEIFMRFVWQTAFWSIIFHCWSFPLLLLFLLLSLLSFLPSSAIIVAAIVVRYMSFLWKVYKSCFFASNPIHIVSTKLQSNELIKLASLFFLALLFSYSLLEQCMCEWVNFVGICSCETMRMTGLECLYVFLCLLRHWTRLILNKTYVCMLVWLNERIHRFMFRL